MAQVFPTEIIAHIISFIPLTFHKFERLSKTIRLELHKIIVPQRHIKNSILHAVHNDEKELLKIIVRKVPAEIIVSSDVHFVPIDSILYEILAYNRDIFKMFVPVFAHTTQLRFSLGYSFHHDYLDVIPIVLKNVNYDQVKLGIYSYIDRYPFLGVSEIINSVEKIKLLSSEHQWIIAELLNDYGASKRDYKRYDKKNIMFLLGKYYTIIPPLGDPNRVYWRTLRNIFYKAVQRNDREVILRMLNYGCLYDDDIKKFARPNRKKGSPRKLIADWLRKNRNYED